MSKSNNLPRRCLTTRIEPRARGVRSSSALLHALMYRTRVCLSMRVSAMVCCAFIVGCTDALAPIPAHRTVIVLSAETPVVTVVNGETGRVAERVALAEPVEAGALSSDESTLYLAEDETSPGDMVALDAHSFEVRWREAQSTTLAPRYDRWNGVAVAAYGSIAPAANGRIYVSPAWRQPDSVGVASLDDRTRDLIAFGAAPLSVEAQGLAIAPPNASAPQGLLLATGRRDLSVSPAVDWLFELDPATLAVVDSSPIVDVPPGTSRYLLNPVVTADGHSVFLIGIGTAGRVYKFDLGSHQVVGSAPLEGLIFATSPDGTTIYEARQSSGVGNPAALVIYDASLNSVGAVDLPAIEGTPPVLQSLTISSDGSRVYIAAGTGSAVLSDGGPQRGRLIAVDPVARRELWSTPLGIWAPRQVFVR